MLISNFSTKGDIFENNPQLRSVKEFDELASDRKMRFVALVADYETPLKQKKGKVRRDAAARQVGYPLEKDGKRLDKNGREAVDGKDPKIEAAIKKYRSLQFDLQKESIEGIEIQIVQMIDLMKAPKPADEEHIDKSIDQAEKTAKFGKMIVELKKQRKELIDTMGSPDENEEDINVKGNKLTEIEGSHLNDLEKYNIENANR